MLLLLLFPAAAGAQTVQHGLRVPAGFEVAGFADHTLANDIFCLTVGPRGQVVVSGRGYVRQLVDEMRGVTGRFSRADLFTAIVQPSKDVPPRYRTTQLTTAAGKTYQGIILYEATDSILLQTGPSTTVRLDQRQIAERRLTALSLMPAGLLDRLTDQEIADRYAYLRGLK
jgi:putative heme-binding domain-containing protein